MQHLHRDRPIKSVQDRSLTVEASRALTLHPSEQALTLHPFEHCVLRLGFL